MYWPIGAPRIYAASLQQPPKSRSLESDDGAESQLADEEEDGPLIETQSASKEANEGNSDSSYNAKLEEKPRINVTASQTAARKVESSTRTNESTFEEGAENETIIDLRASRTGHVFATITPTSLTVWQARVRPIPFFFNEIQLIFV